MKFLNYYRCPYCKHKWEDVWDAMPDDDCPECGARHITPYDSKELTEEVGASHE